MTSLPRITQAAELMESVLRLEARVAAFDCDGTLWGIDAGEGFFSWELDRGLVSAEVARWARPRYANYRAGKVSEDDMCGEMVTLHAGLRDAVVAAAAEEYFAGQVQNFIFPEMQGLVRRLMETGCQVWAVSSTNDWVVRAGAQRFGIPQQRVLAAAVAIEDGRVTDRLLRVPSGEGKVAAIREAIRGGVDAAFGNSIWDAAMLEAARNAFAVNPTSELEEMALRRGWSIYYPLP